MALANGARFGHYEIVSAIGAGGMGEVYRARDLKLQRDVALKVLPASVALDPDRRARFEREAQVLAALNHPNIAAIYGFEDGLDAYPVGTGPALVLELVEGPTLADRLAQGAIPLDETLPIARQICDALEVAHKYSIVHRDLKPANIKVRSDGTVKVLDFGLAKALESTSAVADASLSPTITSPALTRAGVILGTAAYMSPEQARGRSADAQSDIWAFGCVCHEMLSGRRAFPGETVSDAIAAILERAPDWKQLPPNTPARIRRMLRRCLEKDPRRRWHNIADARIEIDDANEPEAYPSANVPASSRRRGRMLGLAAAVLALGVVASLGGVWYARSPADAPELRLEVTTTSTSDPSAFAISPDGRKVVFVADNEGQPTLWVRPLDAASAQPLAGTEGARHPFWSADSRSIGFFTISGTSGGLRRIEAGGGPTQLVANSSGATGGAWGRDGTILFSDTAVTSLRRVNSTGGSVEVATKPAATSTGHRHPQFLPEGRDFLFFSGGRGRPAWRLSELARFFRGHASRGVGQQRSVPAIRLAVIRPAGGPVCAAPRSRPPHGHRRDGQSRQLGRLRAHHRCRRVFGVGHRGDRLPGRQQFRNASFVVRSGRQCARRRWSSRPAGSVESQALTRWPSCGGRAHARE